MPVVKQQLKIVEIYGEIRSVHSRISRLDSLSRPASLDLISLFSVALKPGLDNGMSLARLGPIDEKSSLKALDKSDDLDIKVPFRFISLMVEWTVLREVRSLMACHVFYADHHWFR